MIRLYDSDIVDILPETLASRPNVIALGYALHKAMQRLIGYCQNISVFSVIDSAPDNVLDLLALELNTQYYEDTLDIEVKRQLIKNTLVWYMSAGTSAAVAELVQTVFGEGEVQEWFQYGGDPYTFRIQTSAILTPEINEFFNRMIERVKNTRSHLESIGIVRRTEQEIHAGTAYRGYSRNTIT